MRATEPNTDRRRYMCCYHFTGSENHTTATHSYATMFTLLGLCVSSLRRGHANVLCIVPRLSDDPRRGSIYNHRTSHRAQNHEIVYTCLTITRCFDKQWNIHWHREWDKSELYITHIELWIPYACYGIRMYVLVKIRVGVCVRATKDKIKSHNRAKRTDRDNTDRETEREEREKDRDSEKHIKQKQPNQK